MEPLIQSMQPRRKSVTQQQWLPLCTYAVVSKQPWTWYVKHIKGIKSQRHFGIIRFVLPILLSDEWTSMPFSMEGWCCRPSQRLSSLGSASTSTCTSTCTASLGSTSTAWHKRTHTDFDFVKDKQQTISSIIINIKVASWGGVVPFTGNDTAEKHSHLSPALNNLTIK